MSRRPRMTRVLVATLAALALATPPMLSQANAAPGQPQDPANPEIPQRFLDQQVSWKPCDFDAQVKEQYPEAPTTNCATVKVPMDWQHPDDHPDISLAISRSEATGNSKGVLTTNPGGPGGAGLTMSAAVALDKPQLFSDFDLVGFDPRGFGDSEPLKCLTTAEEVNALPTTPDRRERTKQTHRAEVAEAKLFAEACSSTEFSEFASSQQTVYDMDFIRALLGAEQLNFIGISYGTWLGGWYADAYPSRVGRFVLDSNMDFTRTQWENVNFDPFSSQRRRDTQVFPWIARHADKIDDLGDSPQKVLKRYEKLRSELVALGEKTGAGVTGEVLDSAVYSGSYSNARFVRVTLDILVADEYVQNPTDSGEITRAHVERAWDRVSPQLQAYDSFEALLERYLSLSGSQGAAPAAMLADAKQQADRTTDPDETINLGAIGTTVRCNDTAWRKNAQYYLRQADKNAAKYPYFGYMVGVPMCAFWPFEPQDRDVDLEGSPQVLMIQAELDPATAYEGGARTRERLGNRARFVGVDDEGQHGQYVGGPSPCVSDIGDAFIFSGDLPGKDKVCATTPLPEDGKVYPVDGPIDGDAEPLPRHRTAAADTGPNPLLRDVLDRAAAAGR